MNIGTYPPPNEFYGKSPDVLLRIKDGKALVMEYSVEFIRYVRVKVVIKQEENYTKIRGTREIDGIFYCLESDCKYICEESSYSYNNDWSYNCYSRDSEFDVYFNNICNEIYNNAKNYNPPNNNIRSLEEDKKDVNKIVKASKGYYYEEVERNEEAFYRGYFIIDNQLTIIAQSGSQPNIEQLKLVLNIDSESILYCYYCLLIDSVKFDDINDETVVDQISSGVEPKYDCKDDDPLCNSFIPLKDKGSKYSTCNINIDYLTSKFINKEYIIVISATESQLTIHTIGNNDNTNDERITLKEYGIINYSNYYYFN